MTFKRLGKLLLFSILALILPPLSSHAARETALYSKSEILVKEDADSESVIEKERKSKALAHYTMGIIYDNSGKASLASREYKKALEINPASSLVRLRLGVDYLVLGENDKAIKTHFEIKFQGRGRKKFPKMARDFGPSPRPRPLPAGHRVGAGQPSQKDPWNCPGLNPVHFTKAA